MYQLHQPLNVVDSWPYFEFEDYIKLLNDRNEEERKQREAEEKRQSQSANYGNLSKQYNPSNYKVPNFKPPKY